MSYIRCLTNPEKLYAWSDCQKVYFSCNTKCASEDFFVIPHDVFNRVAVGFNETYDEPVEIDGCRIEEMFVYEDDFSRVPEEEFVLDSLTFMDRQDERPFSLRIKLSYKEHWLILWRVTWDYMSRRCEIPASN